MATLLADSPPAPSDAQAQADGSNGAHAAPPAAPAPAAHAGLGCAHCGAEMAPGQDWCLQCGAGAPGSIGTPSWRSAATVLAAVAVLALGAAAAAVAALSRGSSKAPVVTTTVAQVSTASTPSTTATTPATPGTSTTATSPLPAGTVKPPKIPLTAATPKASEKTATTTPSSETKTSTTTTGTTPSNGSSATGDESQQAAIELDTDAATTYDPYGYPASGFGDPSLAIDDDTSTAWTAQVNPASAPKMAQGLLIDLKDKQKVAVLELISSTPGMTVQVYGAKGRPAPTSITAPAWIPLTRPTVAKKKHLRLALRDSSKQFTFITLWISKAPQSSVGTPEAPGQVAVNEVELFAPKS
jgi:hypothetical protein